MCGRCAQKKRDGVETNTSRKKIRELLFSGPLRRGRPAACGSARAIRRRRAWIKRVKGGGSWIFAGRSGLIRVVSGWDPGGVFHRWSRDGGAPPVGSAGPLRWGCLCRDGSDETAATPADLLPAILGPEDRFRSGRLRRCTSPIILMRGLEFETSPSF